MIESMGFTRQQAIAALEATVRLTHKCHYVHHVIQNNNMERAVDWIFSHADEVATMETDQASSNTPKYNDGTGSERYIIKLLTTRLKLLEYELMAFVSHMGTSTMCGHYVCHIKKDGK